MLGLAHQDQYNVFSCFSLQVDQSISVLVTDTSSSKNQWVSLDLVQRGLVLPGDAEKLFPTEAKHLEEVKEKEAKGKLQQFL